MEDERCTNPVTKETLGCTNQSQMPETAGCWFVRKPKNCKAILEQVNLVLHKPTSALTKAKCRRQLAVGLCANLSKAILEQVDLVSRNGYFRCVRQTDKQSDYIEKC